MKTNKPTPFLFALNFGLTFGAIYITYQLIRKMLGLHYINSGFNQLFVVITFITILVLTVHQFRKTNNGKLTFLQALQSGISVSVFASFFVILYTILLTTVIEPDYYSTYSEANRERHIQGNPDRSTEQIETDVQEGLASLPGDIQKTFVFYIIGGVLVSLPAGMIFKRHKE